MNEMLMSAEDMHIQEMHAYVVSWIRFSSDPSASFVCLR